MNFGRYSFPNLWMIDTICIFSSKWEDTFYSEGNIQNWKPFGVTNLQKFLFSYQFIGNILEKWACTLGELLVLRASISDIKRAGCGIYTSVNCVHCHLMVWFYLKNDHFLMQRLISRLANDWWPLEDRMIDN